MPTSGLTRTTGRTYTSGRLFRLLDLEAERERCAVEGSHCPPGALRLDYTARVRALDTVLAALRRGMPMPQAVDAGASTGADVWAAWARGWLRATAGAGEGNRYNDDRPGRDCPPANPALTPPVQWP